jgi:predicted O-methyltransferase YrrM
LQKIKSLMLIILIKISRLLDSFWILYWSKSPITNKPLASKRIYQNLARNTANQKYIEIETFEKKCGYALDVKWLDKLAMHTQIVIKKSPLCYAHGRVLYSAIAHWLSINQYQNINIVETGTARGFSSVCMAKALDDFGVSGSILTFDLLPSKDSIYWNCIDDNDSKSSRFELLNRWRYLVDKYIIFIQGDARVMLPRIGVGRVHLAYLDGSHKYEDVFFEFQQIYKFQISGDMIIFDDYSESRFPGLVRAVDEICCKYGYDKVVLTASNDRGYVLATRH